MQLMMDELQQRWQSMFAALARGDDIVNDRNLYAADVHLFELFAHFALTSSQYCESRHMG